MTTYKLDVPDDLWEDFKSTVSRTETINERLIELIEADIEDNDS